MKWVVCAGLAVCLVGFCACGQGEAEPTEATTTMAAPEPFEYTATQRIHESLPEFTFALHGYDDGELTNISEIEISGEGFYQRLNADFEFHSSLWEKGGLYFVDYTNDGFLDIRLYVEYNRNGPAKFWLWDIAKSEFVENEQLQELNEGRYALGVGEDGRVRNAPQKWDSYCYEYINGEFVQVEQWFLRYEDRDDGRYEIEETYKFIDGEMKLFSRTEEKIQ